MYRWVFWPLWFVAIPLTLAIVTVSLLAAGEHALPGDGLVDRVRWFVQDQKVPAIIIFFTLFEMALYQLRYSLPFSERIGLAGRPGLPKEKRKEYEHAGQLLDEVHRTLKKNEKEIDKQLSAEEREQVDRRMQQLADAMDAEPFDSAHFDEAHKNAIDIAEKKLSPWQRGEIREYTESIIIAVAVALLLRAFVVEAFKIPSGSMLPTLQIQDHIFVNKFTYGPTLPFSQTRILDDLPPQRGDIVVFKFPDPNPNNPPQDFIKRVVALPGDVLEVQGGHPIINGWPVPNCPVGTYTFGEETGYPQTSELFVEFLGDYAYLTLYDNERTDGRQGPYRVEENEFWVLGDNRDNSSDSRAWRHGRGAGVPYENVKGRAMFVWLSFNNLGSDPLGVTWDRLFTDVLGRPRLPKEAPAHLKEGIDRCLQGRPQETMPPPPKDATLQARR